MEHVLSWAAMTLSAFLSRNNSHFFPTHTNPSLLTLNGCKKNKRYILQGDSDILFMTWTQVTFSEQERTPQKGYDVLLCAHIWGFRAPAHPLLVNLSFIIWLRWDLSDFYIIRLSPSPTTVVSMIRAILSSTTYSLRSFVSYATNPFHWDACHMEILHAYHCLLADI